MVNTVYYQNCAQNFWIFNKLLTVSVVSIFDEPSLRQSLHSYVLGVITQTGKTKLRMPLVLAFLVLMIVGIMAEPRQDQLGDMGRNGREIGQPLSNDGDKSFDIETLKSVERMNYGVSFSPIDGVYTPTEATYNLMLVMDVPMFDPENIPWKDCMEDVFFNCFNANMCALMDPDFDRLTRFNEANATCRLLGKFVEHIQQTRNEVAVDLVARLRSYLTLSAEQANSHTNLRGKRDVRSGSVNISQHGGVNETDDKLRHDNHTAHSMPCNQVKPAATHLTCLAQSLEYQLMTETDTHRRHTRHTSPKHYFEREKLTSKIRSGMRDMIEELESAGSTAQAIDELMYDMQRPHLTMVEGKQREKRGFLNIGGKLLGSLFGLVTEEEAGDMRHAIDTLAENQFKVADRLQTFEKRVVAVANLTNQHLKKMGRLMGKVDSKFTDLFERSHEGILATTKFAAVTASMLLDLMQDVDRVNREMDQFLVGLRGLQRQELSVDLVPEDVLKKALRDLQYHVSDQYSSFSVAETQPAYYYKHGKPAYSWENGTLIVHLTVPLKSTNTAFRLYQVTGYSIPAVTNESLYTRPVLENDVFGISHDGVNFLEMKQKDLETCAIAKTIRCELSAVVRDVFHRSCLLALFQNDKDAIQELCNYRLEAMKQEISLQPISPGRVLVSNAATVSIQCPGRPAIVRPGCKSCLWSQSCSCSLSATDGSSKSVSISPTLTACLDEQWEQKVEFPVNIPALTRLLPPRMLRNISHDAYVKSLDQVPVVNVNVHPAAQSMNMHESYSFSMDIDEAVNQLREQSVLTPLNLDSITVEPPESWANYLPASLGISVGLSALCGLIYLLHHKGCLMIKLSKPEPDTDVEAGRQNDQGNQDGHDHNDMPPDDCKDTASVRSAVAAILHEYATEARQSGTLPNHLQSPHQGRHTAGSIYPKLHEVTEHPDGYSTRM